MLKTHSTHLTKGSTTDGDYTTRPRSLKIIVCVCVCARAEADIEGDPRCPDPTLKFEKCPFYLRCLGCFSNIFRFFS